MFCKNYEKALLPSLKATINSLLLKICEIQGIHYYYFSLFDNEYHIKSQKCHAAQTTALNGTHLGLSCELHEFFDIWLWYSIFATLVRFDKLVYKAFGSKQL